MLFILKSIRFTRSILTGNHLYFFNGRICISRLQSHMFQEQFLHVSHADRLIKLDCGDASLNALRIHRSVFLAFFSASHLKCIQKTYMGATWTKFV